MRANTETRDLLLQFAEIANFREIFKNKHNLGHS